MGAEVSPGEGEECRPWFEGAFGRHYLDLYGHRDEAAARREVEFAAKVLPLARGQRVLDLNCGPGFHLERLSRLGLDPLGVDLSRALLDCSPSHTVTVRGDMRRLPLKGPFDGVLTFFTTLGYFDEEDNRKVLEEISRVLAEGGAFLVDHLNAANVRRSLVDHSSREVDGLEIVERRWIEEAPPRVLKEVRTLRGGSEIRCYTESVRLYGAEELTAELAGAGLSVTGTYGDFRGGPLRDDSPRMILIGKKVGRR